MIRRRVDLAVPVLAVPLSRGPHERLYMHLKDLRVVQDLWIAQGGHQDEGQEAQEGLHMTSVLGGN